MTFRFSPKLTAGGRICDFSKRTYMMGILNVTPDSFSDGGSFSQIDLALKHAQDMVADGADFIDIGGESTHPGAEPVNLDEELKRTIPIIEKLSRKTDVPISIDTYKEKVAKEALDAGAAIVNDISGLRMDEAMVSLIAERNVPVVIRHMQGLPRDMQENPTYRDVIKEISVFLKERAEFAVDQGVKKENIIIDPGIGFGKTAEHNLEIMARLSEFTHPGYPILLGTSRKSFIGKTLDLPVEERLQGTAATVAYGISNGANIIRVHDVKEMKHVARMIDAIETAKDRSTGG